MVNKTRYSTYLNFLPLISLFLLIQNIIATSSHAEPYLAVRYGQTCSACHTNVTGGGKRTTIGNAYATGLTSTPLSSNFSPQLNDHISTGGNFRANWTYASFPDAELQDGDTSQPIEVEDTSAFNFSNGSVYFEFALDDKLSFYLDEQVAPEGGRTREALILYKGIFGDSSYVKAGRFFLPFGWRLQDDQAFIRQSTGFNFDNSDIGVEFGWEPGPWSVSLALSNGTQGSGENNKDKQVSFVGSYIQPNYRIGASFSNNEAPSDISNTAYNIFGGFNIRKLVVLGEVDFIQNELGAEETNQIATLLSLNYLLSPSLNIKLSHEYFEPDDDIDENEQTRISLIAEKFLNQYFQIRLGARLLDGIPQNPIENQDVLFAEFHLFY